MSIDRALQFNTAALAIMGAVFLALGHESTLVPLFLAVAAVASAALTDVRRWLQLNRIAANGIAVVAVVWCLHGFFDKGSDGQLLAIANMLVFLQVVLLFQEKNARVYWQLLVLSLLQVVVAAALDLGAQFGLLLGLYIAMALTSLVLLCIYRDLRMGPAPDKRASRQRMPSPAPIIRPAAWPNLLAAPVVDPLAFTPAEVRRELAGRAIARHVAVLAGATFVFTTVFFYITPRLSEGTWQGPRGKGGTMGFVPEVRLEQGGRIHLSHQVVMRVCLTRLADGRPVELVGDPYFQGMALTDYVCDERGSRWIGRLRQQGGSPPTPLTATNLVRQDIAVEAPYFKTLAAIWPLQRINDTPGELSYRSANYQLTRSDNDSLFFGRQFRFAYGTSAIKSGRQLHCTPHANLVRTFNEALRLYLERHELLTFDATRFPTLAATAEQVIRHQELADDTPLQKALALERHFRAPGNYTYSLNLDVPRDPTLDPIEDFVANHRTGHCEYFASALVLMLRSQGIPARMVTGYKGGDFNSLGRYYVVQQQHAHAWVEAWFAAGGVNEWEIAGPPSLGGAWYRLDPTPPAREVFTAADDTGLTRRVAQAFDYVEMLWRDYVLSLNASRQKDTVYDPLTEQAAALPLISEGRNFHRWLRRLSRRLGISLPSPGDRSQRVFEGNVALIVGGGLLCLFLLVQGGRSFRRYLSGLWRRGGFAGHAANTPPLFYLRLERLLAGAGIRRRQAQTPAELAAEARTRLSATSANAISALPDQVVQAYYRVRFGGHRLDKNETDAIERALAALAPAVRDAKARKA